MGLFDLAGRVAVVTGGNGGIGLGMARGLARAGATLVVVGRNREKSAATVRELEGLGARAVAVEADVTLEGACRALVEQTLGRFGRLGILVNNAGINARKPPEGYPLKAQPQHLCHEGHLAQARANLAV
jgi:2-deoxy-D-gluconate 3-dehydrogenase